MSIRNAHAAEARHKETFEQIFIDFLRGDRSTKIYNFAYYSRLSQALRSYSSGMQSWDNVLKEKSDYYIFSDEAQLIAEQASQIAPFVLPDSLLIELGVGSGRSVEKKTLPFLSALKPAYYLANDLSEESVRTAAQIVRRHDANLKVQACHADFLDENSCVFGHAPSNVLMTGSTISNITSYDGHLPVNEIVASLQKFGKVAGRSGVLVITQDTNQDEVSLKAAYSSPAFVQFRKDTLHRVKQYLNLQGFDPSAFEYEPVWEKKSHLLTTTFVSTVSQTVQVGGTLVHIPKGRRLYASNCYKYPAADFLHMSRLAGFQPLKSFMGPQSRVALHVLRFTGQASA